MFRKTLNQFRRGSKSEYYGFILPPFRLPWLVYSNVNRLMISATLVKFSTILQKNIYLFIYLFLNLDSQVVVKKKKKNLLPSITRRTTDLSSNYHLTLKHNGEKRISVF